MANRNSRDWLWSEALEMLARAGRLHRETFRLAGPNHAPYWEPPVDVLETPAEVQVVAVLPGVDPERLEVYVEDDALHQRKRSTIVDGVGLPPHIGFPCVRTTFAAAAGFLLPAERTANFRAGRSHVHVRDPAVRSRRG